jgi:hypothetical protein
LAAGIALSAGRHTAEKQCVFGKHVLGKKTFQSEQSEAGGRVSGVHPAIQDRSKISWV